MLRLLLPIMLFPLVALGQEPTLVQKADNYIYDGNQAFDTSNNVEAEKNYRRATATGLKKDIAQYNMGTTLQQDNYNVSRHRWGYCVRRFYRPPQHLYNL